jgi:hypothetical protein
MMSWEKNSPAIWRGRPAKVAERPRQVCSRPKPAPEIAPRPLSGERVNKYVRKLAYFLAPHDFDLQLFVVILALVFVFLHFFLSLSHFLL